MHNDQEYFNVTSVANKDAIKEVLMQVENGVALDDNDTLLFTLDKRFLKYICFYNAQYGEDRDDIIIIESKQIENLRKSEPFNPDLMEDLARCANASRFEFTRQKQLFPLFNNCIVEAGLDEGKLPIF